MTADYSEDYRNRNRKMKKLWLDQLQFNTELLDNIQQKRFIEMVEDLPEYTDRHLTNTELNTILSNIVPGERGRACRWNYLKSKYETYSFGLVLY